MSKKTGSNKTGVLPSDMFAITPPPLNTTQDIGMLLEKYSRDVAFTLGIPPSFVVSKSTMSASSAASQSADNTQTFTSNAQSVCRHLERLLSDVHEVIYGQPAEFKIVPSPRVAIEKMEVSFQLSFFLSTRHQLFPPYRTSRRSWTLGSSCRKSVSSSSTFYLHPRTCPRAETQGGSTPGKGLVTL